MATETVYEYITDPNTGTITVSSYVDANTSYSNSVHEEFVNSNINIDGHKLKVTQDVATNVDGIAQIHSANTWNSFVDSNGDLNFDKNGTLVFKISGS